MIVRSIKTFLENSKNNTLLDIRPKKDFLKGHLPNAINIPFPIRLKALRKRYRREVNSRDLNLFIENAEEWKKNVLQYFLEDSLCFVYCQTGGLRSFYFYKFLKSSHTDMCFLKGGYRAYCNFQEQYFQELVFSNLYVLKGKTGSGKTATLRVLANEGKQVLNLSDLAKHQGSAFGNLMEEEQPTSDQFQHNLLDVCLRLDLSKTICIEAEGAFIGSVSLPNSFYEKLLQGKIIELNIPKKARGIYLLEQYYDLKNDRILKALKKIQGRLSPSNYSKAIQYILDDQRGEFVTLIMDYYDQSISYQKDASNVFCSLNFSKVDPLKTAEQINKYC
jgi:tRNA 2-selenouridine synthase